MTPILASDFGPPEWMVDAWDVTVWGASAFAVAAIVFLICKQRSWAQWFAAIAFALGVYPVMFSILFLLLLLLFDGWPPDRGQVIFHIMCWLPMFLSIPVLILCLSSKPSLPAETPPTDR